MQNPVTGALQQMHVSARKELYSILEWWEKHMPDDQHGGFYGRIDGEGRLHPKADKSVILNTRILWTFSAGARVTGKNNFQTLAERAYRYLIDYFWDTTSGGVFWMLDYRGQPVQDKKQVYAQAFAMYAFTEYYRLTADHEALEKAHLLFQLMEKHSLDKMRGGYLEAFGRDWQPIADLRLSDKDANEAKTMNTHLHVLEAYTNLHRVAPSTATASALKALILLFLDKFIDPHTGHLNLFFDEDWNLKSRDISFGHDIEASWLLCEAAEILGNPSLLKKARNAAILISNESLRTGIDPKDGGMFYEAHADRSISRANKDWWPQAEAVVGFMNAWKISGEARFLTAARQSWTFIEEHLKQKTGEWYWAITPDGQPDTVNDKAGPWKCPYHNGRACLEIMHYKEEPQPE